MNTTKFIDELVELYFSCKSLKGTSASDVVIRLIQAKLLSAQQ